MNDRYTGSFFLSLLLHLALATMLFVFVFWLRPKPPEPPAVFEVVAGPGDDLTATEAPASPQQADPSFKIDVPEPLPDLPPPPDPVEPDPVTPEPVKPEPVKPEPIKPQPITPKPPTPPKDKPKLQTPPKEQPKPRPTMTKEEFDKQFNKTPNASQKTNPAPAKVNPKLIDPGAVTNNLRNSSPGNGGTALSAQTKNLMDAYFARLLARVKSNHQNPPGVSDQLTVFLSYHVAANGKVSQVRILRSSGNAAFDQSVLAAFAGLPATMGARPDGQSSTRELNFSMRDL